MKFTRYLFIFTLVLFIAVPSFSGVKKKRVVISDQFELTNLQIDGKNPTDVSNEAPSTWKLLAEGPECLISSGGILDIGPCPSSTPPGSGSVTLYGLRSASINEGTLILETKGRLGSFSTVTIWGLSSGFDENFAMLFSTVPLTTKIACRTINGGTATETLVDIGHLIDEPTVYRIVASSKKVQFYIDDSLVATHKENLPSVPLNPIIRSSDSLQAEYVNFELIP